MRYLLIVAQRKNALFIEIEGARQITLYAAPDIG